jgi:[protein-PII] uridylyltransferase
MRDYLSAREELIRAAVPGLTPARRLARLTDETMRHLADQAAGRLRGRTRWSLIALGGYGAGALLPASDLDLLVVSNASSATIKPFVEELLYPLWDAGLDVGHQVRSAREQLRAVRGDLATLTATLTGRVIAGDERLGIDTLRACAIDARKRQAQVFGMMRERERPGSPYLLEPDLKDGAGGRRDFDELTWIAAVLSGAPQSDPSLLVSLGLLEPGQFARLEAAADAVAAARWELQLAGSGQLMSLDAAEELATGPDTVQSALADTHHLLVRTRARLAGLGLPDREPMAPSELLAELTEGESALPRLEDAAWAGRLEPLVPGFSALMTLRRPGFAHTLTVGAHCLRTAALVGSIGRDVDAGDVAAQSAAASYDTRVATVAALVHDIGKEVPGPGHPERGASTAHAMALRLGLDEAESRRVARLVELHLVLPETASREDLDSEDAILRVAARVGDRDLVAPLHLLTIADSLATGPGAWSDWHAALLGKLVTRLDAALSPDIDGAGIEQAAEKVRTAAAALGTGDAADPEFFARAPLRYLAGRNPEQVAKHAALVARLAADGTPGAYELDVSVGPIHGSFLVTVAAPDRHGLLATLAGVFALAGLDILAVEAVSDPSGVALDTFTLRSATHAAVGPDVWARVERLLDAALRGRFAIGVRLAERRRHYRESVSPVERVSIETQDPFVTVVRVRAADRVGLLHDLARAIAESGLEIASMTATTRQGMAEDVFRVQDGSGEAPREAGVLGQLQMRLRELG